MFNQDFKEFIESLNANQVRYLMVDGYASESKKQTLLILCNTPDSILAGRLN